MYDVLEFEKGFKDSVTVNSNVDVDFSSVPTWHLKDIQPPEDTRKFKVRKTGAFEQKQDGVWQLVDISETGTFYKSIDGKYYAFELTVSNGEVTKITLTQEGEP